MCHWCAEASTWQLSGTYQNGTEPALSAHALIKKASPQSAQDEARSPGLAEEHN